MLKKYDLKFDRVLDGVAVVFHRSGVADFGRETVHDFEVRARIAEGSAERFPCQAETVRRAVVRCSKDDESAIGIGW